MKLGLISDIHADYRALERALALLWGKHGVGAVWCAGDVVGRGTHPNEVAAKIAADNIPTVLGNHDEYPQVYPSRAPYQAWTLAWLGSLPRTYRALLDQQRLVMVHGTPLSNMAGIHPTPPTQGSSPLDWLEKTGADILISGHTHHPLTLSDRRGLLVNPGSLFTPEQGGRASSQTYAVLDVGRRQAVVYRLWD